MKKSLSFILALVMLLSTFATVNVLAAEVPATPTTKATNALNGISVTWDEVENASTYNIYRRTAGSNAWILVGSTNETSFVDKTVKHAVYYCYSVRAYNDAGDYSAYNSGKTFVIRYILAPYTKTVNAINGVKIYWGAIGGATKYSVYRRNSSTWILVGTTTSTSIVDTDVKSGSFYCYSVRAINGTGYSAYNGNKTTIAQFFLTPNVAASSVNNGVKVKWTKTYGAARYNLYRRNAGSSQWNLITTTGNTEFVDTNVTLNKYYAYSVRAINDKGYSAYDSTKVKSIKFDKRVDYVENFAKYGGVHKSNFYQVYPRIEELGGWIGSNWASCEGNVILGYNPTKNTCNAVMLLPKKVYPNITPSSGICTRAQLANYTGRNVYVEGVGEGSELGDDVKMVYSIEYPNAYVSILCTSKSGFDVNNDVVIITFKNQ